MNSFVSADISDLFACDLHHNSVVVVGVLVFLNQLPGLVDLLVPIYPAACTTLRGQRLALLSPVWISGGQLADILQIVVSADDLKNFFRKRRSFFCGIGVLWGGVLILGMQNRFDYPGDSANNKGNRKHRKKKNNNRREKRKKKGVARRKVIEKAEKPANSRQRPYNL